MSIIQYKKNSGQLKLTANVVDSDYVFAGFYKRTDSDRILLSNSNTYTFTPTEEISIDCDVRLSPCGEEKQGLVNDIDSISQEIKDSKRLPYIIFYEEFNDNVYYITLTPEYYNRIMNVGNGLYNNTISIKGYFENTDHHSDMFDIDDFIGRPQKACVLQNDAIYDSSIKRFDITPKAGDIPEDRSCFKNERYLLSLIPWKVDVSERNPILKMYYNEHNELIAKIPILSQLSEYERRWDNLLSNGLPLFKRSQMPGNTSYFETDRAKTFNALDIPFATTDYGFSITPNNIGINTQTLMFSKTNTSEEDTAIPSPEMTSSIRLIIEHEYFRHINNGANFEIPFVYSKNVILANGTQPKFGHLYRDSNTNKLTVYIGQEGTSLSNYTENDEIRGFIPDKIFTNHNIRQEYVDTYNYRFLLDDYTNFINKFKYISIVRLYYPVYFINNGSTYGNKEYDDTMLMGVRYIDRFGSAREVGPKLVVPNTISFITNSYEGETTIDLDHLDTNSPNIALTFYHGTEREPSIATEHSINNRLESERDVLMAVFRLYAREGNQYIDYEVQFQNTPMTTNASYSLTTFKPYDELVQIP